jgi:predicted ATP-binding protein involved in virulence
MLKKLCLENYRCFEKTEMSFRELTVIVGKNNAGKSTLIETLRILSIVVNRCKNIAYTKPPEWLELDEDILGIQPSINNLDISTRSIIYMYGEGPAKIIADFENGTKVNVYVSADAEIFATLHNPNGVSVESKSFAASLRLNEINILPQIGPLLREEPIIKYVTVQKNLLTNLSSRNFRNQLNYFPKEFEKFKELSEKTWQGLMIHSSSQSIRTQGQLFLYVRDNYFEAEIGWMGHGLQMWLQTMWFLSRSSRASTVILDEPDVYMHADLQRRLIKLIKNDFKQVIVATHSVEIMSEVEPENILPVINSKAKQQYANKTPIVQKIVDEIGSVHNIEIARLFSYNKLLIVEGDKDDVKLLTIFQSKIFPNTFEQFDILPKTFVEGWGGWQRVIGSNKVLRDTKTNLTAYCLFDSDYHTNEAKEERYDDAKKHGINLHIWNKKEIENYLIVPSAIHRLVTKKKKSIAITEEDIAIYINSLCEELKDEIIDCFATEIKAKDNTKAVKTVNQEARRYINQKWESDKLSLVSGKQIIASLCKWLTETHNISTNKFSIAREITLSELSSEIVHVISCIENRTDF